MSFRRKLRTFMSHSRQQRGLIAEAMLLTWLARLAVRLIPFSWIVRWIEHKASSHQSAKIPEPALIYSLRRAVKTASRNALWKSVCMQQSLAMYSMLSRRGYGSTLRMGAKINPEGKIEAHAWLESNGQVILGEDGMAGMTPLARFGDMQSRADHPTTIG